MPFIIMIHECSMVSNYHRAKLLRLQTVGQKTLGPNYLVPILEEKRSEKAKDRAGIQYISGYCSNLI